MSGTTSAPQPTHGNHSGTSVEQPIETKEESPTPVHLKNSSMTPAKTALFEVKKNLMHERVEPERTLKRRQQAFSEIQEQATEKNKQISETEEILSKWS